MHAQLIIALKKRAKRLLLKGKYQEALTDLDDVISLLRQDNRGEEADTIELIKNKFVMEQQGYF